MARVRVTVAWPDKDTTEWFPTYPRVGEYIVGPDEQMWAVTRVCQVPAPRAEYLVTAERG